MMYISSSFSDCVLFYLNDFTKFKKKSNYLSLMEILWYNVYNILFINFLLIVIKIKYFKYQLMIDDLNCSRYLGE